jgi:hypothetical protein
MMGVAQQAVSAIVSILGNSEPILPRPAGHQRAGLPDGLPDQARPVVYLSAKVARGFREPPLKKPQAFTHCGTRVRKLIVYKTYPAPVR